MSTQGVTVHSKVSLLHAYTFSEEEGTDMHDLPKGNGLIEELPKGRLKVRKLVTPHLLCQKRSKLSDVVICQ